jgi:glycolate oxidase
MSRPLPPGFDARLAAAIGRGQVRSDAASLDRAAADALAIPHLPDLVVLPRDTADVAALVRVCAADRVPFVVRGAGTGYTGGAVPTAGGVVVSMERMNRILSIDEINLLAVVQPNVINGDLQRAVEAVGLFYPPDPASLDQSSIGGNVAECAGGPRAFKYGTTKRYVLALEVVLPSGAVVRTGSKAVKNVVGYDLTQLLVGSEGTLAVITEITLRLIPRPPARATLAAAFANVRRACDAVTELIRRRAVPAAIELIDAASISALEAYGGRLPGPAGAQALLVIECDGTPASVAEEIALVEEACRAAGALQVTAAGSEADRDALWAARRQLSLALRATGQLKINHDVVVPRGRIPELIETIDELRRRHALDIATFGHAGDGNLHVNLMLDRGDAAARERARTAERELFERVVALEGSITGEHGVGFAKAPYLSLELSDEVIALMKRVKVAFDPHGILNPGKIFPPSGP